MKKLIALLMAAVMVLALCACQDTNVPQTEPSESEEAPTEGTTEVQEIPTEDTTEETPIEVVNTDMALAEECIDKSVEELYELIGQPQSADYAPSCLNPGVGEDGNLYYDGFIVYTYREGDKETVTYVEEAE